MVRNLIIGIQFMPDLSSIMLQKYDIETQKKSWTSIEFDLSKLDENPQLFFDEIRSTSALNSVKAISFMFIDTLYFESFEDAYAFRMKCKDFCELNEIFYHFSTATTIEGLYSLSASKTLIKDGERVAVIKLLNHDLIGGFTAVRKNGCYFFFEQLLHQKPVFTQEWKTQFFMISKPTKVILSPKSNDTETKGGRGPRAF